MGISLPTSSVYIIRMKSLAMLNLNRISPNADFCSEIKAQLVIIQKNVLYITHEVDKVHKLLKSFKVDKDVQEQVDQYFEGKNEETV